MQSQYNPKEELRRLGEAVNATLSDEEVWHKSRETELEAYMFERIKDLLLSAEICVLSDQLERWRLRNLPPIPH